ncbi:MAG: branched-chain amino acid ABC transporter permease [Thermoanaerobaculales bacterium]
MIITLGQSLVNAILLSGMLALVALGFSIVWGVLKVINLAHGSFIMLGAYVTLTCWSAFGIDPFATLPISMVVLFLLGYAIQAGIINWVIRAPLLVTFLLTFGLDIVLVNLALFIWKGDVQSVSPPYAGAGFSLFFDPATSQGIQVPYVRLAAFGISLLLAGLLHLFMSYTRLGRAIQATGQDKDAAQLTGVRVAPTYALTFAIGAALAGAAGSLISMMQPFDPGMGGGYRLRAFIIVVLGGLGSIPGVILGAALFAFVDVIVGISPLAPLKDGVAFAMLVVVLIVRPSGIAGKAFY